MRLGAFGWALLAALVMLTALNTLQIGLSMAAMGAPIQWGLLAGTRALFLLSTLPSLVVLAALRRALPPARNIWQHFVALIVLLTVFGVYLDVIGPIVDRLVFGPGLVVRGSRVAKVIADVILFGAAIGFAMVVDLRAQLAHRDAHARELEVRLAEARLQALSQQLHPHFLFNTLNTIAVLVHRDPQTADAVLTRLADLLRETLREPARQEIALREEMVLLERYLDIMRIRFGDRLAIESDVPEELGGAFVPTFVLQPLVENAIEHAIAVRSGPGRVRVTASRTGARLALEVIDDGPGPNGSAAGIGLGNTRRRLATLYGDAQLVTLEPAPGGGARTRIEIPLREASPS